MKDAANIPEYVSDILRISIPTVPYNVFKHKYLPMLLHAEPSVFNLTWIREIAKSPHARVNVVDSDGDVVYSIPPIADSLTTTISDEVPFILQEAQLASNIHANKGIQILNTVVPIMNKMLSKRNPNYIREWQHILEQEGLHEVINYIPVDVSNVESTDDSIDIDYGDDGW